MALFRIDASFFPRHYEVQTRCLMTIPWDQSGNDVVLAIEPSETPDLEVYTFLRPTSSSFSYNLTDLMPFDSFGCSLTFDWAAKETLCYWFQPSESAAVGKCSDQRWYSFETHGQYAPGESKPVPSWSTTTSVDKAGWTQVVIQEGRYVLLDVRKGQSMAMVNASINDVAEAGLPSRLRLSWLDGATSKANTFGCSGLMEMINDSSCPNNIMR